MRLAIDLSSLAKCRRGQVGCVIVPEDYTQVLAIGYNGQASGIADNVCSNEPGNCGCIHAEMNALIKLNTHMSGLTMVSTVAPCKLCAGLIINSKKITRVVYTDFYRDGVGLRLLDEVGIEHVAIQQ